MVCAGKECSFPLSHESQSNLNEALKRNDTTLVVSVLTEREVHAHNAPAGRDRGAS